MMGAKKKTGRDGANTGGTRSIRDEAEEQLARSKECSPGLKGQTPEQLIHELGVHQIELEMQAEQLRVAQLTLEESRDKYLDLYEFAPLGYLTLTDKALITEVNHTGTTLLGVERSNLVNHGLGRFIAPADHEVWDRYFADVRQHVKKQSCTLMLMRGDGSLFPARLESNRITGSSGAITVRLAISDITEIRQVEEELHGNEEKYRHLFETAQEAILLLDGNTGEIFDANTYILDMLGYPLSYFVGKHLWELGFIRDKSIARHAFTELKTNSYIRYEDIPLETKDGRSIDVEFISNVYLVGGKKIIQCNIRDITERKRAEEELSSSEAFLNSVIELNPQSMWVSDSEGTMIRMNQACRDLFGLKDEEVVGKYNLFKDNLLEEQGFKPLIEDVFRKGEIARFTIDYDLPGVEHVTIAGATHMIVDVVIAPIKDTNGKVTNAIVQHKDITDRRRAEEALLKNTEELHAYNEELTAADEEMRAMIEDLGTSEKALRNLNTYNRNLLEASLDPLVTINYDGKITDVNTSTERATGYSREELIRTDFSDYFTEPEKAQEGYLQVFTNGTVRDYPLEIRHRDGHITPVLYNATVYRDEKGNISGVFAAARDITELKRAEEALKQYSGKLEETVSERTQELRDAQEELVRKEKLVVLGKLSGGVGHELRNPLGAIKNVAYFLTMALENPDEEIKEMLGILNKEVARSEEIISSLLDFARPKAPVLVNTDVSHVMTETLERFPLPHAIKLVNTMSSTLPEITADSNQLVQVFGNLVTNAYQAMPDGGTLTITSDEHKPGWVFLSVADTGMGISDKNMKKLFEPLFTTKAKGIGLGLVVVKTLIEAHGGRIEVKSEAGKGTMFTVTLPVHGTEGGVK